MMHIGALEVEIREIAACEAGSVELRGRSSLIRGLDDLASRSDVALSPLLRIVAFARKQLLLWRDRWLMTSGLGAKRLRTRIGLVLPRIDANPEAHARENDDRDSHPPDKPSEFAEFSTGYLLGGPGISMRLCELGFLENTRDEAACKDRVSWISRPSGNRLSLRRIERWGWQRFMADRDYRPHRFGDGGLVFHPLRVDRSLRP